ncbi:uncharacterized protein LOC142977738 [Anticarsia gemmatalis]|uniref:uncharacterized protein LOC142977738 n=1 Tax=Anticarsia gemmatalis TaxID=129554 RepID=UPI003F75AFED
MLSRLPYFNQELPIKEKVDTGHPWEKQIKHAYSRKYKYCHNSTNNPVYPKKKDKIPRECRIRFTVIGNRMASEFLYCLHLVKALHKHRHKEYVTPVIRGVSSLGWPLILNNLKSQYGSFAHCKTSQVIVFKNDEYLGGGEELKKYAEDKLNFSLQINYYKEGLHQLATFIKSSGRPCAYLQIAIDEKPIGVLLFLLYSDVAPQTCENFLRLCETTKGGYAGTPVHRIVKDCWIQCGGFGLKNNPNLTCENFIVPHDRRGVLCMANEERDVDCSTQFFVLLQPAPWMEHKYVAFGQLIEGENTLEKIENVPTWYEAPTADIKIFKAGVFNMDCQRMPTNKCMGTHEYIVKHIDDLYDTGAILFEIIMDNVYTVIKTKEMNMVREKLENLETVAEEYTPEDIFYEVQTAVQEEMTDSKNFSFSSSYRISSSEDLESYIFASDWSSRTPSSIVEPMKPFYIPLTDVPYSGDVDSNFDLKKLLKGDYCLESDLEKDPAKRKSQDEMSLDVPEDMLDELFECFEIAGHSDDALDPDDDEEIRLYIKANVDEVSFAGPVVKKMANIYKKFQIFDDPEGKKARLLSDEELRIYRLAAKEYQAKHSE